MSQELWMKFDKLRGIPAGSEELAKFFQEEGLRFSARDLATWGQFVAGRFGRGSGMLHVPEWLAGVFVALAKDASPNSICDPWAGLGFLVGVLREACQPEVTIALTPKYDEHVIGAVLVPEAKWRLGEPLQLLNSATENFDLVASILPMGRRSMHPLCVSAENGTTIELRDDLGNLIMVSASLHLLPDGIGLFVVPPSFFFSQHSVFRQLGILG